MTEKQRKIAEALGASRVVQLPKDRLKGPVSWLGIDELLKKSMIPFALPKRTLGKTGLLVTGFGLGGQALLEQPGKAGSAVRLIQRAMDLGVNYFDTATMYGPSRMYYGKALGARRRSIVLTSKVRARDYAGAKKEIDDGLKVLNTDYIDIVLLHGVDTDDDKVALRKNGAIKAIEEAKLAGKVHFCGLSGHQPDVLLEFMGLYPFDVLLVPVNPAVEVYNGCINFARGKRMGVVGMKVMARGILPKRFLASNLLHYAMKLSDVAIVGCSKENDLDECVMAAKHFSKRKDYKFLLPRKLKSEAAFVLGNGEPWPDTYQPNFPTLQYER